MEKDSETMDLSIVVPVYNEKESVRQLYEGITRNLVGYKKAEIVFIDDGSSDGSHEELLALQEIDSRIIIIRSRRNKGKSSALMAGFDYASGAIAITMDSDLQDDPDEIPNLIHKLNEGYDLVAGWKFVRKDSLSRRLVSRLFNFIVHTISGCGLHDLNCGLKAFRKELYKSLVLYGDIHRLIPAISHLDGFKVTECKVNHFPRKYGTSKYSVFRIRGIFDLISVTLLKSFHLRPFHFFGFWGSVSFVVGLVLFMLQFHNLRALMIGLFCMGVGALSIIIGFVAEMITSYHLHMEKKLILNNNVIIAKSDSRPEGGLPEQYENPLN